MGLTGQQRPKHLSTSAFEQPAWALACKHPLLSALDECHPRRGPAFHRLRTPWSTLHTHLADLGPIRGIRQRGSPSSRASGADHGSWTDSEQAGAGSTAATDGQLDWLQLFRG